MLCTRLRQILVVCAVMWVWQHHSQHIYVYVGNMYIYIFECNMNSPNRNLKIISITTIFSSCYRIDFDDSAKPTNLANSAVLRMLEEEENQKRHGNQSGE